MIGNVQTGDRVDVYVSFKKEEQKAAFLRLVAPYVVVLDAGRPPSTSGLGGALPNATANVVLEVNIHQAAELAFSSDFGKVWLVLSPPHGTSPSKEVIDELSILAGNPGVSQEGTK
jgi:Flp pilus assembly protein CpaB